MPSLKIDAKGHIIGDKMPLVSLIDDRSKPEDSMPKYFKEMEKHGLKITRFTFSSIFSILIIPMFQMKLPLFGE